MRRIARWLLVVLTLALPCGRTVAQAFEPAFCLPPLYDGGQRLHQLPTPRVFWLELALRQHEICWRRPARPETRIAMLGSSAVFGFPLPVEQTLGARLNAQLAADGIPAHVYNLGWVNTYQLRDAIILREVLPLRPDVILYPVTLAEFIHVAPMLYASAVRFFSTNLAQLSALIAESPPGLAEPLAIYEAHFARHPQRLAWRYLREIGMLVRVAVRGTAERLLPRLVPGTVRPPIKTRGRQTSYDCDAVRANVAQRYARFAEWSVLPYLRQVQERHGTPVLVVNWPMAHEPVGECYNVRFTAAIVAEFNAWLRREAAAHGLAYLDLHDALPPTAFLDSLHLGPEGHAAVAERIYPALLPLIARRAASGGEAATAGAGAALE